jgi:magnesium transporter
VFALRRDLAEFRRAVAPMREVVDAISRKEVPFVCDEAIVFFRDVFDRTLRALDYIESERDLLTSLLEADLAVISNRLNDVMKKVTSWGAILLGATLIAGIYGMNFKHMPELGWSFGYPLALASMLGVMVVLYIVFKKRGWL